MTQKHHTNKYILPAAEANSGAGRLKLQREGGITGGSMLGGGVGALGAGVGGNGAGSSGKGGPVCP